MKVGVVVAAKLLPVSTSILPAERDVDATGIGKVMAAWPPVVEAKGSGKDKVP